MATNGQLMTRFLRGEKLLDAEILQLERAFDSLDRTETFVNGIQNGTENIRVNDIQARTGFFEKSPAYAFAIIMGNPNVMTIPNNTEVVLVPTSWDDPNIQFSFDEAVNRVRMRRGRLIAIVGTIQWASNATGRRAIHIKYYDINGALLGAKTIHSLPPTGVASDTFPILNILDFTGINAVNFEFTVIQTSGANLNVEFFQIHHWIVQ